MSFIDSNLPIFHLLPSRTSPTSETTICQSQNDSKPIPKYLKRRDPGLTDNYSISFHDAFYPDITYASIAAPAIYPSQARKNSSQTNSNSPPDPPRVPAQIAVNLYNPDSRVVLTQKPSSWGSGPYWEFSLPKTSFLQPTGSKLDHSLDVTKNLLAALPVATFRWRKEGGVLSRSSLRCSLIHPNNVPLDNGGAAPSSDPNGKRKAAGSGSSEPDITVAIFTNGLNGGKQAGKGEITIFEPNLKRVEVEDVKGLEVTLVMTAIAIADMYFGDMRTNFNLGSRAPVNFSGPGRAASFGLQQQMDLATRADPTTNNQQAVPQDSSSNSAAPPPYMGGPPPGFTGDTKVRPTQEQLFNPTFQQQLRDEEQRRQEAAERAERERWEAAVRAERERREAVARAEQERREAAARAERERRLAEQEAEARRLQQEFEAEAAREAARIDAETRRLRAQYEQEAAEMEARQRRPFWGSGNSRPQTQPGANGRRLSGHQYMNRPPSVTQMAPWEGHGHTSSMGEANGAPPRPPRPQNNLSPGNSSGAKLQPKKSGWFGGKTLDSSKDRRKSFMGLRMFGESGGGDNSPPPPKQKTKEKGKDKAKGKLEKKKSGMW